jgi:exopolysaccharide biosynthesis polyprenyl glycosylphosphotransferase
VALVIFTDSAFTFLVNAMFTSATRLAYNSYYRKAGGMVTKALILYTCGSCGESVRKLEAGKIAGCEYIGVVAEAGVWPDVAATGTGGARIGGLPVIGEAAQLGEIIKENVVDEAVILVSNFSQLGIEPYISLCERAGVAVHVVFDLSFKACRRKVSLRGSYFTLSLYSTKLSAWQLFAKRLMDIAGALAGLCVTGALLPFVALAIKLDSPGPVFFKQPRVGENGRLFGCYKFRSMCRDAEALQKSLEGKNEMKGSIFKMKDDPRMTRVGRFLRASSIDELPQFWNVLKSEMSLVGTRPPTVGEVGGYELGHHRRISIKPGLTGIWQTSGRNKVTDFEDIVALDLEYINNWSLWLDVKILCKTVGVVFGKSGV